MFEVFKFAKECKTHLKKCKKFCLRVVSKGGLLREDSGDISEEQVLRSLINPVKNFKQL